MKTEITMQELYWNPSLIDFFMRQQAQNSLLNLLDKVEDKEEMLNSIDDYFDDLDDMEEFFYSESDETIWETFLG